MLRKRQTSSSLVLLGGIPMGLCRALCNMVRRGKEWWGNPDKDPYRSIIINIVCQRLDGVCYCILYVVSPPLVLNEIRYVL